MSEEKHTRFIFFGFKAKGKTISDTVPISPVQLLWTFYIRERLDYPKAGMTKAGRFEVDWVTRVPHGYTN